MFKTFLRNTQRELIPPPPLLTEIGLNLKINSLFVLLENLRSFLHLKVVLQKFDFDLLCEAKMFSLKEYMSSGDFLKFNPLRTLLVQF